LEWQGQTVGPDEPHARILAAQERGIVEPRRRHRRLMRIPGFEVVGGLISLVGRYADVEDAFMRRDPEPGQEALEHLAALVGGYSDGNTIRLRDVELGVRLRSCHSTELWMRLGLCGRLALFPPPYGPQCP